MLIIFCLAVKNAYSQEQFHSNFLHYKISALADSNKNNSKVRKIKLSGLFLSFGAGINVPTKDFKTTSIPTFGILGRLEYSSTAIFPFVAGVELNYVSYKPDDQFLSENLLSSFRTKILGFGLTIEYSLARFFNSAYTTPFLTFDVKTNKITHEYDATANLPQYPLKDSKTSIGIGAGFTLFVLDFYFKYNFMKQNSNFGVYTKIKFPVIRF